MESKTKTYCLCGCKKSFVPRTGWHVFFSVKCKHRHNREMARAGKELARAKVIS